MPPRTSRRQLLRSLLLVSGAGLLAACSPAAPPSPTAKPAATAAPPAASPPAAPKPAASPAASPVASPAAVAPAAARVDPALASVWAGKNLNLIIGSSPGGGYDTWGRIITRHLGKHLPGNPTVVPQNMPGGVHRIATNFIYTARPDGLTMGIVDLNIPFNQLRGEGPEEGVRYDVTKLNWLGSASVSVNMPAVHQRTGITIRNLDELKSRTVKMGLSTPGDPRHLVVVVVREVLGWKFESIFGYPGSAEIYLGIQRGEVDGTSNSWDAYLASAGDDIRNRVLLPILQVGPAINDPLVADVPTAESLAASAPPEKKQLLTLAAQSQQWARPFVTPPEMPDNILATMRAALLNTLNDPELKSEASRVGLDTSPVPGDRVQALITDYMKLPRSTVEQLDALIKADSPG
ncbi:MAG: Bug family tripartite tricarboxylate transporter substrate binding protein [Chloroflexota bacterium]